jgi:DNA polymerase-4
LAQIALSLRERIDLGAQQHFRLVGVGLSNFRDVEDLQSPLFDITFPFVSQNGDRLPTAD